MQNDTPKSISWQVTDKASERSALWYVIFIAFLVTLAVVAFLLHWFFQFWQFWSAVGLGILMMITLVIVNRRSTGTTTYTISDKGIEVGKQKLLWGSFRAFSLSNNDKDGWFITLIPIKRLTTADQIPISADKGEAIVDMIGSYIPMEQPPGGIVADIVKRLKI